MEEPAETADYAEPGSARSAHPHEGAFAQAGRPDSKADHDEPKKVERAPLLVSRDGDAAGLSGERILRGLRGTNVWIGYQDRDLVYLWIANPPPGFEAMVGQKDRAFLPAGVEQRLGEAKRRCLDTGEGRHLTLDIGFERPAWYDIWLEPDFGATPGGKPEGVITVATEVTEHVEREDRLRVLLREVSHRSRNLLSIVQSIAAQTVRASSAAHGASGGFLSRFNERLQSLAHTLDLVTLREWEGATLHQLVSRQARPFRPREGSIAIGGPDPVLTPNAALHLGLAVQELASNAVRHGAWGPAGGEVEARTRMDGETLLFEWSETGARDGEEVLEPGASFGSRTLMAIVPTALGGEASMVARDGGFTYRLTLPAANFG